jgi:hypothetical protein
MSNRGALLRVALMSIGLLGLVLSGCETKTEQSTTKQDQQQAAGSSATGSREPAAAEKAPPAPPAPPPPPRQTTLAAGMNVTIFTTSTLSTKTNKSGEAFEGSLAQDIVDGDWIIAKKGASVSGVIANSDPGGKVKGTASITLQLKKLTLASGEAIPIATNAYRAVAKSTKKKDAAKVGIGAGVGAAIGAIAGGGKGAAIGAGVGGAAGTGVVLATHGDPATIPAESRLTFRLNTPVEVTETR